MLSILTIKEVTDRYFEAFEERDLETLSKLYSDNIILNEWNENLFIGKENVLEANKKLFSQFSKISIYLDRQGYCDTSSMNQIIVSLGNEATETAVKVVDIIDVNENTGLIDSIIAYRGF